MIYWILESSSERVLLFYCRMSHNSLIVHKWNIIGHMLAFECIWVVWIYKTHMFAFSQLHLSIFINISRLEDIYIYSMQYKYIISEVYIIYFNVLVFYWSKCSEFITFLTIVSERRTSLYMYVSITVPFDCWSISLFSVWTSATDPVLSTLAASAGRSGRGYKLGKQQQLEGVTHTFLINHPGPAYHKHTVKL